MDFESWPLPTWKISDYRPLHGSDFRLLYIDGFKDNVLQCSLQYAALDNCSIEYIALSYCWQSQSSLQKIELEGRELRIAGNLFLALKRLHEIDKRPVWADAICINQADNSEKEREIGRMTEIYSSALWTAVWLGEEADDSGKLMDMLSQNPATYHEAMHVIKNSIHESSQDDSVALFFQRPYWCRTWIIQEIALSRDPFLLCGSGPQVKWDYFETIIERVCFSFSSSSGWINDINNLIAIRNGFLDKDHFTGMLQVILLTRTALATIVRDKVYGLMSLASDRSNFVRDPSYSRFKDGTFRVTDEDVSKSIFETFVHSTRSLDLILTGSTLGKNDRSLPSWCSDFLHVKTDPFSTELADYVTDTIARKRKFYAGTESVAWRTTQESQVNDPRMIMNISEQPHIKARCFHGGIIHSLGPCFHRNSSDERLFPMSLPALINLDNMKNNIKPPSLFRLLLLWSFYYKYFETNPAIISSHFNKTYYTGQSKNWVGWINTNLGVDIFGNSLGDLLKNTWPPDFDQEATQGNGIDIKILPSSTATESYSKINKETEASRAPLSMPLSIETHLDIEIQEALYIIAKEELRLMTVFSSDECWLGLGHVESRPGDHVYLLEGCSLPVILRPQHKLDKVSFTSDWGVLSSRQYQVVGHSYIDGMMNGEVWSKKKHGLYTVPIY
jgi:hypothetical protein